MSRSQINNNVVNYSDIHYPTLSNMDRLKFEIRSVFVERLVI